jgi:hypothetical protein
MLRAAARVRTGSRSRHPRPQGFVAQHREHLGGRAVENLGRLGDGPTGTDERRGTDDTTTRPGEPAQGQPTHPGRLADQGLTHNLGHVQGFPPCTPPLRQLLRRGGCLATAEFEVVGDVFGGEGGGSSTTFPPRAMPPSRGTERGRPPSARCRLAATGSGAANGRRRGEQQDVLVGAEEVINEGDGRPPLTQAPQLLCHRMEQAKAIERLGRQVRSGITFCWLRSSATRSGQAIADGRPRPSSTVTRRWRRLSGCERPPSRGGSSPCRPRRRPGRSGRLLGGDLVRPTAELRRLGSSTDEWIARHEFAEPPDVHARSRVAVVQSHSSRAGGQGCPDGTRNVSRPPVVTCLDTRSHGPEKGSL